MNSLFATSKNVKSGDGLITVFENALEELYDNHFSFKLSRERTNE